jgi:D-galacturonate reductase
MRASMSDQYPQVDKLGMVGVNGGKFSAIRAHLDQNIAQVYKDIDTSYVPT